MIRVQNRTINEEGAHLCLSRLREGRWIRVQKRTINEEGAHMCLSRLREGRWIRVQKRTINEEVLPCVHCQVEERTMDKCSEEDNQ